MDLNAQTKNAVDITVNTQPVLGKESQDLARHSPYYQQQDGPNDDFWAETHPSVFSNKLLFPLYCMISFLSVGKNNFYKF